MVGAGNALGSDFYIRKLALSLKKNYIEFPPKHYIHNEYCYYPKEYFNRLEFSIDNYVKRYFDILEYVDVMIVFMNKNTEDVSFQFLLDNLNKNVFNKPYVIIN